MSTSIHINRHLVRSIAATANPELPDLITLTVHEGTHETAITMRADLWRQAVDQLAGLGICADTRPPSGYVAPSPWKSGVLPC